jgi:hypothetical protein
MSYSRQNPSPRYRALLEMYQNMHQHGETFMRKEAINIRRMIEQTGAQTILDYGSGKGTQYDPKPLVIKGEGEWDSVIDFWGVDEVTCFDPAYAPYSTLPTGRFDGVVCTDVLEHCPEEDIDWILHEIFSYAERFVYLAIACYPANKRLPNGENAHCTIQPVEWWRAAIQRAAATRPGAIWEAWLEADSGSGREAICLRGGALQPVR